MLCCLPSRSTTRSDGQSSTRRTPPHSTQASAVASPTSIYLTFIWLIPLLIVVICLIAQSASDYNKTGESTKFHYGSRVQCGVFGVKMLNYALGLVVIAICAINLMIAIYVKQKLGKMATASDNTYVRFTTDSSKATVNQRRPRPQRTIMYQTPLRSLIHLDQSIVWHLWSFLAMSVIIGPPWMLGFLSALSERVGFSILYIILNAMQGILMLILLVVFRTFLSEHLINCLTKKKAQKDKSVDKTVIPTIDIEMSTNASCISIDESSPQHATGSSIVTLTVDNPTTITMPCGTPTATTMCNDILASYGGLTPNTDFTEICVAGPVAPVQPTTITAPFKSALKSQLHAKPKEDELLIDNTTIPDNGSSSTDGGIDNLAMDNTAVIKEVIVPVPSGGDKSRDSDSVSTDDTTDGHNVAEVVEPVNVFLMTMGLNDEKEEDADVQNIEQDSGHKVNMTSDA